MQRALAVFRDNAVAKRRVEDEQAQAVASLAQSLSRIADGDLTARLNGQFAGPFAKLQADFNSAMGNAQYSYDIDPAQIQITGETMAKYGVSKMAKVPTATDYVKLDLLADAKKDLGIQ